MRETPGQAETARRPMNPTVAGVVVFVTSGAVLVLEILSLRLVAPYLGLSLDVSTAVIGFALAAIAAGAWLGGQAADRWSPERMLGPTVIAAGGLILLVGPVVRWTGEATEGADSSAVFAMAALAVFFPAALLSAVSPMVVKLQLDSLAETGSVVGRYSGIGTVGALVGTFATGFFLVAKFPTSRILLAVGGGLILLGVALAGRARLQIAGVGGVAAAVVGGAAIAVAPNPCDVETAYHCATVIPDANREGGRTLRLDTLAHSYVDLDDPTYLHFGYVQAIAAAIETAHAEGRAVRALHVGGGGGTLPRYLAATRPGSDNLVFEIDGGVVELDRDRLGLRTGGGLEVKVRDGRLGLAELATDSRDVVVMDAFGGLAVPWHLTTREVVQDVERVLVGGGIYAVNVIDYPPADFARAEVATIAETFDHVALLARPPVLSGAGGGNLVILASDQPLPLDALSAALDATTQGFRMQADPAEVAAFAGDAQVLTDDFAPVDQLLTKNTNS